ncbi:restriction endonuclease subunit S, partial [Bacillus mycoides]
MVVLKRIKLEDEIELLYGKALPKKQRVAGDIPVYGSNGIVDYHVEGCFKGPSIILGRKGTVGAVEYSKGDFWAIDTTYIVKTKSQEDDIKFWYYFLKTLNLDKMNTHSAVPGLNRGNVYALTVDVLDSYAERKRVAEILSSIDEKIEINNQINKKLDEIAQVIYKQWFVDFEFPNEGGHPYKSSGGEMVESDLGVIPEGWEVKKINYIVEVTDYVANGSFAALKENVKTSDEIDYAMLIRLVDYNRNFKGPFTYVNKDGYEFLKKSKLFGGEIIISNVGANAGTVFRVPKLDIPMTLGPNSIM